MRVIVSGSSGLIGAALVPALRASGHEVRRLVRGAAPAGGDAIAWNPERGVLDAAALEGVEAVVHLAGENIAAGRWTAARKSRIRDSRVQGTKLLAERLAGLARPPRALICASATGFYGDRGDDVVDETSAPGTGFLPDVCQAWEQAADPARRRGLRVAHLRFGVVLSTQGGALKKMLAPFRTGLGGRLGSGRQWMSWITLDDAVAVVRHVLANETLSGPVNVVAPGTVSNADFTRMLGRALGRPTIFPMPAFAARLAFGELADALLLASTRVRPSRLFGTGFPFGQATLDAALRTLFA